MLLFPRGERPDASALCTGVASAARTSVVHAFADGHALELLRDGLTFDLVGLAPGPPMRVETARHLFGVEPDFAVGRHEALALQPGPHIAAGAHSVTVVRTLAGIAAELAPHLPRLAALGWAPASALIGPDFFASTVSKWLDGGAFPALGLTAFAPDDDGSLRSEGLAWFTGQEIALDPALCDYRAAAVRLAIRLVNQLVGRGALSAAELIVGPEGERLLLEPDRADRVVRVRRG
jgi:hypothetical protein